MNSSKRVREAKLTTRSSRRIRLIIVQLDVRVRQRLVQTLHHGLDRDLLRERVGEDVPRGDLDRLLPQVVLQDDETRVELRGVAEDGFPVGEDLLGRGGRVEVEVYVIVNGKKICQVAGDIGAVPSVSKVAVGLRRVHMTGVKPRAMEMLRTRSLETKCPSVSYSSILKEATHSISPKGGLIIFGVTPRTSLIIFLDHPSSAIISSFVNVVKLG
jgi:hypothetical protein